MPWLSIKHARPAFWLILLFVSATLITYALWLYQIDRGNQAYRAGDLSLAGERYEVAAASFRAVPWLAYLVRDDFETLVFNRAAVLYGMGKYDLANENLREAVAVAPFLAQRGEFSYWSGNLLFRSAAGSKNPQDFVKLLNSALEEYHRGLQASPNDWDLKYNYELARKILSQSERGTQEQQKGAKSILDLMRPSKDPASEELPPEKRG